MPPTHHSPCTHEGAAWNSAGARLASSIEHRSEWSQFFLQTGNFYLLSLGDHTKDEELTGNMAGASSNVRGCHDRGHENHGLFGRSGSRGRQEGPSLLARGGRHGEGLLKSSKSFVPTLSHPKWPSD